MNPTARATHPGFSGLLRLLEPSLQYIPPEYRESILTAAIKSYENLNPGKVPTQLEFESFLDSFLRINLFQTAFIFSTRPRIIPIQQPTVDMSQLTQPLSSSIPISQRPDFTLYIQKRGENLLQSRTEMEIVNAVFLKFVDVEDDSIKRKELYNPKTYDQLIYTLKHGGTVTLDSYFRILGTWPTDQAALDFAELILYILYNNHTLEDHAKSFIVWDKDLSGNWTFRDALASMFKFTENVKKTEMNFVKHPGTEHTKLNLYLYLEDYAKPLTVFLRPNINQSTACIPLQDKGIDDFRMLHRYENRYLKELNK